MTTHENDRQTGDDALLRRAAEAFDDSVAGLDARTRSRLNRGRQRALAQMHRQHPLRSHWIPAGAAAAVGLLAVLVWNETAQRTVQDVNELAAPPMAADFDMLTDEVDLDMLEDLEFYSWIDLDEQLDESGAARHVG